MPVTCGNTSPPKHSGPAQRGLVYGLTSSFPASLLLKGRNYSTEFLGSSNLMVSYVSVLLSGDGCGYFCSLNSPGMFT